MRIFNQLKIETLMTLSAKPNSTSKTISTDLRVSVESAEMVLHRCWKQKLVDRTTRPEGFRKPPFQYTISQRGLDRLLYLQLKKGKEGEGKNEGRK